MDLSFPDIYGADRGFNVASDIVTTTTDGVPLNNVYREFVEALNAWNQERNLISRLFTFDTTQSFALVPAEPGAGDDFEPESEFGIPKASRRDIDYLRMGFPLEFFDARSAFTHKYLRDAPYDQLVLQHNDKIEQDSRLLFRKTLSALTDKATSGNRDENENGVQIFDLWDGSSGEVPPTFAGKTFSSSHSHYLVSGAATLDSGDIEQLIGTVQEHGFGVGTEKLVLMVHPDQADVIATWRRGEANANGAVAKHDYIPSDASPAYLTIESIVGDKPPAAFQGLPIAGSYGDALVFKSYYIPTGYVIALSTSGPGSARNPLAFRQHVQPALHGLRLLNGNDNTRFPLVDAFYQRGFGVGVRNRSAAAVLQIKASGSYDNPTWP